NQEQYRGQPATAEPLPSGTAMRLAVTPQPVSAGWPRYCSWLPGPFAAPGHRLIEPPQGQRPRTPDQDTSLRPQDPVDDIEDFGDGVFLPLRADEGEGAGGLAGGTDRQAGLVAEPFKYLDPRPAAHLERDEVLAGRPGL